MANAADVLGEPITRTLGGRDIKFEMFNFGLVAEFQRQQKRAFDEERAAEVQRRQAALSELVIEGLSPFDRGRLLLQVYDSAPVFDLVAAMYDVDGSIELLTLCARKHQPEMTAAEMATLLPFSQAEVQMLVNALTPASVATEDERRVEMIAAARGRLARAIDEPTKKKMRDAAVDSLGMLYEATGEQLPEKYGGQADPPAAPASTS